MTIKREISPAWEPKRDKSGNRNLGSQEPLIDVKQLALHLGVSDRAIYDLVRGKEIPHYKVGRLVRFDLNQVLSFLQVTPENDLDWDRTKSGLKETKNNRNGDPGESLRYVRGTRNPFKNLDEYGNLIEGDE